MTTTPVATNKTLYFLGIGGIGMSALARYAIHAGYRVYGYDRTRSELCRRLEDEGCTITYADNADDLPAVDLCVYTPAIPSTNAIYRHFVDHNTRMVKRAEILGELTRDRRGLAVAGTHGKTTTSTILAHLLRQSPVDTSAFLGGISINYDTNLLISNAQHRENENVVLEADEFDRSFHHLRPYMAVVTATDPDHLDIYGTHEAYLEAFAHFTSLIQPGGALIHKKGINLEIRTSERLFTYSGDDPSADFHADNIRVGNGQLLFDYVSPDFTLRDLSLGVPVRVNVENAVAAMAVAQLNGVTPDFLRSGIASFRGVRRRFEIKHSGTDFIHIDDYAHHPDELSRSIASVAELYADRRIVVVFQPHLYTRTRDFHLQFAAALSAAQQVVILDIYPARELPIPGVTSQLILDHVTSPVRLLSTLGTLPSTLATLSYDVILTVGAGDIGELTFQKNSLL